MAKGRPRKHIPLSEVLKVGSAGNELHANLMSESYPNHKQEAEGAFVNKLCHRLQRSGRQVVLLCQPDPPDAICEEEGTRVAVELLELVSQEEAEYRSTCAKYEEWIRKELGNPSFHLTLASQKQRHLPPCHSARGRTLINEVLQAVRASEGGCSPLNGSLFPNKVLDKVVGFMYNPRNGVLAELKQDVYFSSHWPAGGVNFAPTAADLEEWAGHMQGKWLADYSYPECSECILLLYRHAGRPDRDWLNERVATFNEAHGIKFAEVWFLKPYPDGRDDIWNVFDCHQTSQDGPRPDG